MAKRPRRTPTQLETLNAVKAGNMDKLKPNQRPKQGESLITNLGKLKQATIHRNARRSTQWFKNKIMGGDVDKKMLKERIRIGRLYAFIYDAKTADKLKHWDRHPLSIPIEYYKDGFLALNLHYLPPKLRIILLNKLDRFAKGSGEQKRLALSYQLLKGMAGMKEIKPCIKRYLYSHVKSKFAFIPATEWELAAFMPLASFAKESKDKVYRHSQSIMRR